MIFSRYSVYIQTTTLLSSFKSLEMQGSFGCLFCFKEDLIKVQIFL